MNIRTRAIRAFLLVIMVLSIAAIACDSDKEDDTNKRVCEYVSQYICNMNFKGKLECGYTMVLVCKQEE